MQKTTYNMRTFYTLILTQVFSIMGSRISGLAIGIWVYEDTGNATPLTLVAFFGILPIVLASSISGVLADRWDRRYVMAIADAGQAVGTVLLLISFASGNFELWHLYTISMLQSIFGVFQGPAFTASVTMLVPDNQRDRANAIQQITQPAANIVAPTLAGFVYAGFGVEGSLIIDLLTFLVAMTVVFSIYIPRPEVTSEGAQQNGTFWYEVWGGLRYLRARPVLFFIVIFVSFVNFLVGGVGVLQTPYLLARTGSSTTLGLILSAGSAGAIVGAIIIGAWGGTRPRMNTIMPGLIFGGAMLVLIGSAQHALLLGIGMFFFMLPLPMVNSLFMSILQAKVPPDLQGRVFAALGQISMLLTPLAYLMVGPLADNVFEPAVGGDAWGPFMPLVGEGTGAGMGLMFMIAGVGTVMATLLVYARSSVRHMEVDLPDYVPVTAADTESVMPLSE